MRGRTTAALAAVMSALLLSLSAVAVASQSSHNNGYHPPTGFGGYNWSGSVRQISARWHVPTIDAASPAGHASTWIGAQSQDGAPPFIQLGTTEDLFSFSSPSYAGFWSDSHVGYHPQFIENINANDMVSAEMQRVSGGWKLTFADLTTHQRRVLTIDYGASGSYNQGEWLQEDPTEGNEAATDLPYPQMALVTFDQLLVNGKAPKLTLSGDGQALLSSNGTFLVPGAVHDDAFSFFDPTGSDRSYLIAASTLDKALSVFQVALDNWPHLSKSQRKAAAVALRSAYATDAFELAFHSWPDNAKADIKTLSTNDQLVQKDITTWIRSGLSMQSNAFSNMTIDQGDGDLADEIRSDLGLPPA